MQKYEILRNIGKGSFGNVFKIRNRKSGDIQVIKKIELKDRSKKEQTGAMEEVNILKKLDHVNILKYLDSFIENGNLCIITEYCERGDLHQFISKSGPLS